MVVVDARMGECWRHEGVGMAVGAVVDVGAVVELGWENRCTSFPCMSGLNKVILRGVIQMIPI